MVAIPISHIDSTELLTAGSAAPAQQGWTNYVAAGTIVAGGALMITGHKKAGLAIAAAGTALALLEEPAVIEGWWNRLPGYLAQAQFFLDEAERYIQEASIQGQRLKSILHR
ncbi:hypothetical protein [Acidicapsa ligni]|uniref:hypothetical protein n=1 Tax=Acidicapsa ligni TaxID=542300 RepID=UPI0021DFEF99|nr:hypothetical protein [Acidicapsa ligni]